MATSSKVYDRIWLSRYFHDFPHINFKFERVNSTFDPENHDYQQALANLVLLPIAVSILLWIIYFIYFTALACQRQNQQFRHKRKSSVCMAAAFVLLLSLLAFCLIGFGFYHNEKTNDGIDGVELAVTNINTSISLARVDLDNLNNGADDLTDILAESMEAAVRAIPDPTVKKKVLDMVDQLKQQAVKAKGDLQIVGTLDTSQSWLTDVHDTVHEVEYYRWLGTILVLVIYLALFVCILCGLLKGSKRLLMIMAGFGVFLALIFWAFFGSYLGSSVGFGDFCMKPTEYLVKLVTGSEDAGQLLEYMECRDPTKPYQTIILEAQAALTQASTSLDGIAQSSRPYQLPGFEKIVKVAETDIQQALGNLSAILTNVGTCTVLHNYYIDGINSACRDSLTSVALLLMVSALLALLSAVTVFCMSFVWRNYGKRPSSQYVGADDGDPFLPHPPPYESAYGSMLRASPQAWSDRGALRAQHSTVNEEQVMFMRHQAVPGREDSPPPAYQSGQFGHQYMDPGYSAAGGKPRTQ